MIPSYLSFAICPNPICQSVLHKGFANDIQVNKHDSKTIMMVRVFVAFHGREERSSLFKLKKMQMQYMKRLWRERFL